MARASRRPKLVLTDEEKTHLDQLRQSRTAAFRDVQRAQILWRYHAGETVSQIARARKMTRKSVLKWIDKTLQIGAKAGMKDAPHKPLEAVITDDAKAWVVHLACCKPKECSNITMPTGQSIISRSSSISGKESYTRICAPVLESRSIPSRSKWSAR